MVFAGYEKNKHAFFVRLIESDRDNPYVKEADTRELLRQGYRLKNLKKTGHYLEFYRMRDMEWELMPIEYFSIRKIGDESMGRMKTRYDGDQFSAVVPWSRITLEELSAISECTWDYERQVIIIPLGNDDPLPAIRYFGHKK